jgi:hypothetical protein
MLPLAGCSHRSVDYGGVAVMEGSLRSAKRADAAIQQSAASVAIIETDVGRGMGFVVDPSGYLITNRHVIEDADHIEGVVFPARDPSRVYGSVRVVYIDPERDLALLHVHSPEPLPALPLATAAAEPVSSYLAPADPVVLIQRDASGDDEAVPALALQHGQVSALEVDNPAAGPGSFVGVTPRIRQGQSGGPVLDRHGRAVGVVTWTWRDRDGGFAIPIADAMRMLAERPPLEVDEQQRARAELRARLFLDAVARGDGMTARRFTSPSEARRLREDAVDRIMAETQEGEGLEVMRSFVAALDEVAADAERLGDPELAGPALGQLLMGIAGSDVRRAVGEDLSMAQVIPFFQELGDGYLRARILLGQDSEAAMTSAMQRLRTVDAARSFALADLVHALGNRELRIRRVEILSGTYASTARVELEVEAGEHRSSDRFDLHLRLEWGDFYVVTLEHTSLG